MLTVTQRAFYNRMMNYWAFKRPWPRAILTTKLRAIPQNRLLQPRPITILEVKRKTKIQNKSNYPKTLKITEWTILNSRLQYNKVAQINTFRIPAQKAWSWKNQLCIQYSITNPFLKSSITISRSIKSFYSRNQLKPQSQRENWPRDILKLMHRKIISTQKLS